MSDADHDILGIRLPARAVAGVSEAPRGRDARDRRARRRRGPRSGAPDLVGRGSEPQPRDQRAGPQSSRRAGRDRRRHGHADAGPRLHRRARPAGVLGLAAPDRTTARPCAAQGGLLCRRRRRRGGARLALARSGKLAAADGPRRRHRRRPARPSAPPGVPLDLGRGRVRRRLRGDRDSRPHRGVGRGLRPAVERGSRVENQAGGARRSAYGRRRRRGRAGLRDRVDRRGHPRPLDREGGAAPASSPFGQGRLRPPAREDRARSRPPARAPPGRAFRPTTAA